MRSRSVPNSPPTPTRAVSATDLSSTGGSSGAPARVIRVDEVMARTGLSRTTLWRLERRGVFPARRQLSPGTVGWIEAEVEVWILSRLTRAAGTTDGSNSIEGLV